jgi:hypothetical protein
MPHDLSADAKDRRINAQPWEPLPGMVKLRCTDCHFWFAARSPDTERCADCALLHQRKLALEALRKAPADAA